MVTAITKGIKISVISKFEGFARGNEKYVFSYKIHIENNSNEIVQLLRRHWFIYDSNGAKREVEGEGVIGEQPILKPNEFHQYASWLPLMTEIGMMHGTFLMQRESDLSTFKVVVPEFQLIVPFKMN